MLREEAIKYLKEMKDECNDTIHKVRYVTQEEVLEMAIKALEQEPNFCQSCKNNNEVCLECEFDSITRGMTRYESVLQEPSGDLISRQAVQDYIAKYLSQYLYNDVREAVEVIDEYIGELPSVEQEQKTGHWIDHQEGRWIYAQCSECETIHDTQTNYCPDCGARMEG